MKLTLEQIEESLRMEKILAWGLKHRPWATTFTRDNNGYLTSLTILFL